VRVLITGGAGYIGAELTCRLARRPEVKRVSVYDNLSRSNSNLFTVGPGFTSEKVHFIEGEILDSRKLRSVLQDVDVVYHLAGSVSTPFADQSAQQFEQTNHWGTAELVYAVEESDVSRLIYASSASVYGSSQSVVSVESEPSPVSYYGNSKLRGEEHVERLSAKRHAFIARCASVYGYGRCMRFDAVINKFVFDAHFKGRVTVHGDGRQHRPFIHIDKVVSVFERLLDTDLPMQKFDVVDRVVTINELVESVNRIYPDLELLFINQHLRLRELNVAPSETVNALFAGQSKSLVDELEEFKKVFNFGR